MNIRRKNRLWIACAVLAGLALTIGLVLYALRSNIDLFYTPGEILYGKRETQQMPEVGQRLRVGGMVMPGSVQRDPNSLKVTFTIYDAEGSVDVSYEGIDQYQKCASHRHKQQPGKQAGRRHHARISARYAP